MVLRGRMMAENKRLNDATEGNGDWNSWRRLILSQLEEHQNRVQALEDECQQRKIELVKLRERLAFGIIIFSILANALVTWALRKLGV